MAWTVKKGKVYSDDDSGWSLSAERIVAEVERLKAENGKLRSELEQSDLKTWLEADKQRDCEDN